MRKEFYDVIKVLTDRDQTSDEEVAEFFVEFNKLWDDVDNDEPLSLNDMKDFDERSFCEDLRVFLGEIVHSQEICQGAWWKNDYQEQRKFAFEIVEAFEELLESKNIMVPSDDREGGPEEASLYGCEYYDLVDTVTEMLVNRDKE